MALKTYLYYGAVVLLCALFLMWFTDWLWLQATLSILLYAGFCMMAYNEGGWSGERACTVEKTISKRIAEGKGVAPEMEKQRFNKKHAVVCFLIVSIPLCALATANLIASPNYPAIDIAEEGAQSDDPFSYDASQTGAEAPVEPMGSLLLRVITRFVFLPLIALYSVLQNNQTLLYIVFIPFSFIMPACTAIGYLNGPKIRDKKLLDIARGKHRKQRGLLVNRNQRGPKQPKPEV